MAVYISSRTFLVSLGGTWPPSCSAAWDPIRVPGGAWSRCCRAATGRGPAPAHAAWRTPTAGAGRGWGRDPGGSRGYDPGCAARTEAVAEDLHDQGACWASQA